MIATINGVPVYDALIGNDEDGMTKISLVDRPAVKSDFLYFQEHKQDLMFSVEDEDKHLVLGVVMRADFPIYRRDKERGEFYLTFKPETIRLMAEKYLFDSKQNEVNLQHGGDDTDVENVKMVQWFIKDTEAGISPIGFEDIKDGSLFAEFHVEDEEVWAAIKDGTYKGFSLEGVFELQPETEKESVEMREDSLDSLFTKLFKQNNMSKLSRVKEALNRILVECGNVTTDKGILYWESEDDLKEGDEVFVEDADGNRSAAEDGDYTTPDAKIIVVVDGKVAEIKDAEAEVSSEGAQEVEVEAKQQNPKPLFRRVAECFESYEEKEKKMIDAVAAKGVTYPWLVEAGDDFAVFEVWDEATGNYHYYRYSVSWDEEGNVILGDAEEVKSAFIPVEEEVEEIVKEETSEVEEVVAQMCEYLGIDKAENTKKLPVILAEMQKEIAELKAKPMAKPAHEEVVASAQAKETGVKGLNRLARIMGA